MSYSKAFVLGIVTKEPYYNIVFCSRLLSSCVYFHALYKFPTLNQVHPVPVKVGLGFARYFFSEVLLCKLNLV